MRMAATRMLRPVHLLLLLPMNFVQYGLTFSMLHFFKDSMNWGSDAVVFPHAFMLPVAVAGFAPPPQVTLAATIDLMQGSQKNPSIECIAKQAKLNKEVYR